MHTAFPRYIEHQHVTIITHTRANQRLYFDMYLLVPHRTTGPQGTEDGHIKEFMETLTYDLHLNLNLNLNLVSFKKCCHEVEDGANKGNTRRDVFRVFEHVPTDLQYVPMYLTLP